MAIELKLKVTQSDSGTQAILVEKTGVYSLANTGGWGAPNPPHTDAETATVAISKRNENGTYSNPTVVDIFTTNPNIDESETKISAEDAGVGETFADGIYKFLYTVTRTTATPFSVSVEVIVPFTHDIDCCYQEKSEEVSRCNCACDEVDTEFTRIALNIRLMNAAFCCGNLDQVQGYIDYITKLCDNCANVT